MARTYSMKERAARRDDVRRRIVDAAVVLKQTRRSGEISMAEVAEQAGVGRVTVYRHFRDLDALKQASSQRYFAQNPPPDPTRWAAIANPHDRLRAGLAEAHAYHRRTERMIPKIGADGAEAEVRDPYRRLWKAGGGVLAAPFALTGEAALRLRAAIDLGLNFEAWRLLVYDQGLSDDQALDLVLRLCFAAADLRSSRPQADSATKNPTPQ
jgi:AcrR family transcriptional regulator